MFVMPGEFGHSSGHSRAASSSSISPSPPSDGGEGWGEEVRFYWFPLSSVLSPLIPRGERMESLMQPCRANGQCHLVFDRDLKFDYHNRSAVLSLSSSRC